MKRFSHLFLDEIEAKPAGHFLEIGVAAGKVTKILVQHLRLLQRLYCVDPSPSLTARFRKRFCLDPRLKLAREQSLEFLNKVNRNMRFDMVLIDGDHNYYTVLNELLLLRSHLRPGAKVFLHDILWPYGRRDLYYNPASIPDDYRQPYGRGGVVMGQNTLSDSGRNPDLFHALVEGGPRNGVMTAIEDFLETSSRPNEFSFRVHYDESPGLGVLTFLPTRRRSATSSSADHQ